MTITREALVAHRDKYIKVREQMAANLNMVQGVIDTDNCWIAEWDKVENEPEKVENEPSGEEAEAAKAVEEQFEPEKPSWEPSEDVDKGPKDPEDLI